MELFSKTADNNHKLQNGEKEEEESQRHFSYAMQLVTSISLPMVLMSATRLGLFDIIAGAGPKAQLSPSQIASRLSKSSPTTHKINRDESNHLITNGDKSDDDIIAGMLDRMMRLLASHSVLTCSSIDGGGDSGGSQRMYGLAPVGEFFVRNKHGVSLGPFLDLIQDKVFTESWYELEKAVVEGGVAFDKAHGTYSFDYPVRDSRFNEVFNKAMVSHTTIVMDKLLESYKGFENIKTLVDVGGGLGVTLEIIRAKYPNLRGINFDLPHVIQHAPPYTGVAHIAGDMFERVPDGDAIFMKWILHDWSDDHCLKLLRNCHKALPKNGKVIVMDAILPMKCPDTSSGTQSTCQLDMIMLAQNPGGKERNEEEFLALALEAGFQGIRLECFVCNLWVMEFYK